jgi:hypothetical protein
MGKSTKYERNMIKTNVNVCNVMKASGFLAGIISGVYKAMQFTISCPLKKLVNLIPNKFQQLILFISD